MHPVELLSIIWRKVVLTDGTRDLVFNHSDVQHSRPERTED